MGIYHAAHRHHATAPTTSPMGTYPLMNHELSHPHGTMQGSWTIRQHP
jgi:hypothetical protein